jgi:hypothetical protein
LLNKNTPAEDLASWSKMELKGLVGEAEVYGTLWFRGMRLKADPGTIPPPRAPLQTELDHDDVLAALSFRLPRNVAVIPSGRCDNPEWTSFVLALGDCRERVIASPLRPDRERP